MFYVEQWKDSKILLTQREIRLVLPPRGVNKIGTEAWNDSLGSEILLTLGNFNMN